MKARAHVFVREFVQGVFFRYETRTKALQHKVTGWVKNLRDGRVEAVFEGEKEAVEAMIDFCRHGPPGATVTGVDVLWEEPTGEFDRFRVLY
ncbi:acylphosphatase [Candidatus Bathyarchaeota archaeon]|nr:acylphosphatase [Candidatus Bathyarchaeota archaeon]